MSFKLKGLDQVERQIAELERKASNAGGTRSVPVEELLTSTFLARFSDFTSFDDMVQQSGFTVKSEEDFAKIPPDDWDRFVNRTTQFSSWQDMLNAAGGEWLGQRWDSM